MDSDFRSTVAQQSEEPDAAGSNYDFPITTLTNSVLTSTPLVTHAQRYATVSGDMPSHRTTSADRDRGAPSPPGYEQRMEDMFRRMSEAFVTAMSHAPAQHCSQYQSHPLPEFRGMDHESADSFVGRMEDHFRRQRIVDPSVRLAIIAGQLKGDAQRWYEPNKYLVHSYAAFVDRLISRYDSPENIHQAMAKLYGEKQKVGESAGSFIMRKMSLINRTDPTKPESLCMSLVLDQLQPELRSRLRGQACQTLEELATLASKVEEDMREANQVRSGRNAERRPNDAAHSPRTRDSQEPRRPQEISHLPRRAPDAPRREPVSTHAPRGPSTPCRYCPGQQWHFHSDCPNNPYHQRQNAPNTGGTTYRRPTEGQQPSWRNNNPPPRGPPGGPSRPPGASRENINRAATPFRSEHNPENRMRSEDLNSRASSDRHTDLAADPSN